MKKIILLSEDNALCQSIIAGLKDRYDVSCFDDVSKILEFIEKEKPDVSIIDNDIKQMSALDAFRKIKRKSQKIKSIMLAGKGDINCAVLAGKAGISDFIPKPLEINKLVESIEAVLVSQSFKKTSVLSCENTEWLGGTSGSVHEFIGELEKISQSDRDIVLISANGTSGDKAAQIIHNIGANKRKKFIEIDLSSYEKESTEPHFWSAMQELVSDKFTDGRSEKDITGTVCLNKFDCISDHFQKSIINYLSSRETSSIDRNIKFILVASKENPQISKGFVNIIIPELRDRKEDIPIIAGEYIKQYCEKYNKQIKGISSYAFELFMFYDWQGNYRELECVIGSSVLKCTGDFIDIQDIPADLQMFISASFKKIVGEGDPSLINAKAKLKKELIELILKYTNNDLDKASIYLDVSKTVLNP